MTPLHGRLAALATLLVAACASTEMPDVTPNVDPNLPGVEGSGDPSRADAGAGSQKLPAKDAAPADEEDDEGTSSSGGSSSGGSSSGGSSSSSSSSGGSSSGGSSSGGSSSGGSTSSSGGTSSGAPKPAQGEVLITEVMYDTTGAEPDGEWFELHNVASTARSLAGLTFVDGANRTHTIKSGTTIDAGAYVVFVRNRSVSTTANVPGASSAYEYGAGLTSSSGIQLANGDTGALFLKDGSTTIAVADYGGWFSGSAGSSVQLKTMTYAAGSNKGEWCLSANAWSGATNNGTPGGASDCP